MKKILLADDDRNFRNLIQMKLEQGGHSVIMASDGGEALTKFLITKPDAVILDGMMPRMDGFSLSRAIRQTNIRKHVVIIIMSGVFKKVEYKLDAGKAGADCFLTKPFDLNEFSFKLENFLVEAEEKTRELLAAKVAGEAQKAELNIEKKVVVYQPDGMVLKGTTLELNPEGHGFVITDWKTKDKVFVKYDETIKVEVVDEF